MSFDVLPFPSVVPRTPPQEAELLDRAASLRCGRCGAYLNQSQLLHSRYIALSSGQIIHYYYCSGCQEFYFQ